MYEGIGMLSMKCADTCNGLEEPLCLMWNIAYSLCLVWFLLRTTLACSDLLMFLFLQTLARSPRFLQQWHSEGAL